DVGDLARALAPFGPTNASTSASRIQIVLQRTGQHDSAQLIEHLPSGAPVAPGPRLESDRVPNTLAATAGQSVARPPAGRAGGGRGAGRGGWRGGWWPAWGGARGSS